MEEFENVRRSGLIAINLGKEDKLSWVKLTTGTDEIVMATSGGQAIRFKESDVRAMGRGAGGVRGVRLKRDDRVIGVDAVFKGQKGNQLMVVSENGYGKRSDLKLYKIQKRGGSGIKTASVTSKTGKLVSGRIVNADEIESDLFVTSTKGQIIRIPLKSISVLGRATQGVRIMNMKNGDKVGASTII